MDYINSIFNKNSSGNKSGTPVKSNVVNPPVTFTMDRHGPSSFEMNQMEYGNAPYNPDNKAYVKMSKKQRQRDGVRFGENKRKFFDKTMPATSINNRHRASESASQQKPSGGLIRSRSLSDSLSDLSELSSSNSSPVVNVSEKSNTFRPISSPISSPKQKMSNRSPSPVTMSEYNDKIQKDSHEKELALALMKRPSSPETGWHGGARKSKRRRKRSANHRTKRRRKRSAKRSAKRRRKRGAKRTVKRLSKGGSGKKVPITKGLYVIPGVRNSNNHIVEVEDRTAPQGDLNNMAIVRGDGPTPIYDPKTGLFIQKK